MSVSLQSPPSSAISTFQVRNRSFFSPSSLPFKFKRPLPLVRASAVKTGSLTELDAISKFSEIISETVILSDVKRFPISVATVSSALLLDIYSNPRLRNALDRALADSGSMKFNKALVYIGTNFAKLVPGRVSTEVDARVADNTHEIIVKVFELITLYRKVGITPERLLFKIPATWHGIEASRLLESDGFRTHLTCVYSFEQAAAAAEIGTSVIEVSVGHAMDWSHHHSGDPEIEAALSRGENPGSALAKKAYNFIHKYKYKSKLMAAVVHSKKDLVSLLGVDYIIVSLKVWQSLKESVATPEKKYIRRLSSKTAATSTFNDSEDDDPDKEVSFDSIIGPAAAELLNDGLNGYVNRTIQLEELLGNLQPPPNM